MTRVHVLCLLLQQWFPFAYLGQRGMHRIRQAFITTHYMKYYYKHIYTLLTDKTKSILRSALRP